jgi:hypothetical protein
MRKHFVLKSSLLLAAIFCFLPYQRLSSCGWDYATEYNRFWVFQPDLVESSALLPYTFCVDYEYGGDEFGEKNFPDSIFKHEEYDTNVREWHQYTKSAVKSADIHAIMYDTAPNKFFNNPKDSLTNNTFYAFAKQHDEVYRYLTYAKKCEEKIAISPWEAYTENLINVADSLKNIQGIEEGEKLLKSCQNPFLKQRYAFQVIRQAQYFSPDRVAALYEANFKNPNVSSWVNTSAAYYYAFTKKNTGERNYWLSKCFDAGVDKQRACIRRFVKDSLQLSLPYATTNHEKAVQYVMKSLQYPARGLELLKQIYALDPDNREIPMLLEREVNKLEHWLMSEDQGGYYATRGRFEEVNDYEMRQKGTWNGYKAKLMQSDMAYLKQVRSFVKVLSEGNHHPNKKGFFKMSAAYLAFLNKDLAKAKTYLNEVKAMPNLSPRLQVQTVITSSMIACYESPKLNENLQQEILHAHRVINKNEKALIDVATLEGQLYRFWSIQLLTKGDVAEGFLMLNKTNQGYKTTHGGFSSYDFLVQYAKPNDYDKLLQIVSNNGRDYFQHFLVMHDDESLDYNTSYYGDYQAEKGQNIGNEKDLGIEWDINKIKNYKATYYIHTDNLDSALAVFKTIPDEFWHYGVYPIYVRNPFSANIYGHTPNPKDSIVHTKTSIVERMIALKKEAAINPEKTALNNYYLGNAYYNMCYNGNCWIMSNDYKSNNESLSKNLKPELTYYYNYSRAIPYYQAALKASKDDNFTAMCVFMLDVCKQNALEKSYQPQKPYAYQLLGGNKTARGIYDNMWSNCEAYQAVRERIF